MHRSIIHTLLVLLLCGPVLAGEVKKVKKRVAVHRINSAHLEVHTDLPSGKAQAQIEDLEKTLDTCARFWGRPLRGKIQCYLVDDVKNWIEEALPHNYALLLVHGVGGVTLNHDVGVGAQKHQQSIVYAAAKAGIPRHEIMHAYCSQAFGAGGPEWFKEGIAEMACFGGLDAAELRCPPQLIPFLKAQKRPRLAEIAEPSTHTQELLKRIQARVKAQKEAGNEEKNLAVNLWSEADRRHLVAAKTSYLWGWVLCHMMRHNPNYATRFRKIGRSYLKGQSPSVNEYFSDLELKQMQFEFDLLVDHFALGIRPDLIGIDWSKRRQRLAKPNSKISVRVAANRGLQSSGLIVEAGKSYRYESRGKWTRTPQTKSRQAGNGDDRLLGVILDDKLKQVQKLRLRKSGQFTAKSSGVLLLRCNDALHEIADNTGAVVVQFKRP